MNGTTSTRPCAVTWTSRKITIVKAGDFSGAEAKTGR